MSEAFIFRGSVIAKGDVSLGNATVRKLWNSFCLGASDLTVVEGKPYTFSLGDVALPTLHDSKEYALCVTEKGIAITGKDYGGLLRGLLTLLMKVEHTSHRIQIKCTTQESSYTMKNRMIHICVFPENDIYFIKKLIRLAGLCQYTHIVIEFWGMLQFDCLKELAWPHAFTKEQARELIVEARDLGMEPIPMFNQLGHATGSRIKYGKHVVLDQNKCLQHLFTPDGWAWNIHSSEVYELLSLVRQELYDLFGSGEYMHIGCDEAYYYTRCDEKRAALPDFLHRITEDVVKEGRRPMLWMDMLLERGKHPGCFASCAPQDLEKMTGALHPSSVMVDWQYDIKEAPIPTLLDLKDNDFDVMGAPWLTQANYEAHADTIEDNQMFGIMLTTWHTLQQEMHGILGCAKKCGAVTYPWSRFSGLLEETATLLRAVSFERNNYTDCGWSKYQIEDVSQL